MFTKPLSLLTRVWSALRGVAFVVACLGLVSCDGVNSGDADVQPTENVTVQAPVAGADDNDINVLGTIEDNPVSESATVGGDADPGTAEPGSQEGRVGLIVESTQRCASVAEPFQVVVTRQLLEGEVANPDGKLPNVSGLVKFDQSFGSSLNLLSRTDEGANFEMRAQDIVGLTASIDNGSVTAFIAGFNSEAPPSFIFRKPVPNGCLYAFKSGDYCATGLSKSGPLLFNRNGASMSAVGCELDNPDGLPVVEIAVF